jgi:hypothetical protein
MLGSGGWLLAGRSLILTAELAWSRFLPSLCDTGPRHFSIDRGAVYESAPHFSKAMVVCAPPQ